MEGGRRVSKHGGRNTLPGLKFYTFFVFCYMTLLHVPPPSTRPYPQAKNEAVDDDKNDFKVGRRERERERER